jgi:tetratricopeptide (TPR) repeat protein
MGKRPLISQNVLTVRVFNLHRLFLFTAVLALAGTAGCGPQRKNIVARTYHNTVAYFNGFYHANLNYEQGVKKVEESTPLPTDGFLPLVTIAAPEAASSSFIYFDTAIVKNDIVIFKHPNSNWNDDARFLTGRCHYYKGNYSLALQNFNYVLYAYPKTRLAPKVRMWMARTYFVTGNKFRAMEIINQMPDDVKANRKTRVEIAEMRITLLVTNQKYNEALQVLQDNISVVKGKERKAKWNYLMGQLYQHLGQVDKAYYHYQSASRFNVSTELTFMAKLRQAGLYASGGNVPPARLAEVKRMLEKLLADSKYRKFYDQVYYQLALLDENQGNVEGALKNLQKSLDVSTNNPRQKVLSYAHSGEIYFHRRQDFFRAQAYYDSAAALVTPQMPEHDEIKTLANTLREFVRHRTTVHAQDSLLRLSQLAPQDQNEAARRVIEAEEAERRRRQAEEARLRAELARQNQALGNQPQNPFDAQTQGQLFYFDDQAQVARGKTEFQRIWGNRPNEDHWRRKNKMVLASVNPDSNGNGAQADSAETMEQKIARYVANIPNTPQARDSAHGLIQTSLFELGQLYAQKLNLPDSGATYLKRLVQNYPSANGIDKAYYALYTLYKSKPDAQQAEVYKKIILENYPNSQYARLINRERVSDEDELAQKDFNQSYATLLQLHNNDECNTVIEFGSFLINKHQANAEVAKMYFLRAQCFAQTEQRDSAKAICQYIVSSFPSSEITPIAKKMLQLLQSATVSGGSAGPDTANPAQANASSGGADSTATDPRFLGFDFVQLPNDKIYVVIFIEKSRIRNTELNVLMSDFHRNNYASNNLRASVFSYKPDTTEWHMVYVSQFPDYPTADAYVRVTREFPKLTALLRNPQEDVLFISPNNFRQAYVQKRFNHYLEWYKIYYQKMMDNGTAGSN